MTITEIIEMEIEYIKEELKTANIDSYDGLCYWCSYNICVDLGQNGIDCEIHNINENDLIDYSHYYVIVNNNYLIDLTYSQFAKKENEKLIAFSSWPSDELQKTEKGKLLLSQLLNNGYFKIDKDNVSLYINSFTSNDLIKSNRFN